MAKKRNIEHNSEIQKFRNSHDRTVRKIHRLVKIWKSRLYLNNWDIDVMYDWNGIKPIQQGLEPCGTCDADWKYMQATLHFGIPMCSVLSHDNLERVVIHELLHAIVNEMRQNGIEHEERVVSHLERVIKYIWR